jgi:hypothetical protein
MRHRLFATQQRNIFWKTHQVCANAGLQSTTIFPTGLAITFSATKMWLWRPRRNCYRIIKVIVRATAITVPTKFSLFRIGLIYVILCKSNGRSSSAKCSCIIDYLSNHQLLMEGPVPWNPIFYFYFWKPIIYLRTKPYISIQSVSTYRGAGRAT